MKKIIIYFVSVIALIILEYFLSIVLVFQLATKREGDLGYGFKDVLITLIWLLGIIAIVYFIVKFLVSVCSYKK